MTRILVTGGAGFIGSHLVDRLLDTDKKIQVVCVDCFDPFYDPKLKEENLKQAGTQSRFSLCRTDICDRPAMEAIFRRMRPDCVVHLAARAGVRPSISNPAAYYKTNVEGTLHLLECAREWGTKKFIFGSSSSVYGISSKLPFSERDPLSCPISPYAMTKILAENLCRVFQRLYGFSVVCLRFFTVYGPRQRPEMAIAKFTRSIRNGQTIDLYGDGSSRRDYTFVDDIVDGILAAMDAPLDFELINLGNARAVPLRHLISVLESQTKIKARVHRMSNQPGDVPVTFASLAKARRILGYKPKVSIKEGIQKYLRWLTHEPRQNCHSRGPRAQS